MLRGGAESGQGVPHLRFQERVQVSMPTPCKSFAPALHRHASYMCLGFTLRLARPFLRYILSFSAYLLYSCKTTCCLFASTKITYVYPHLPCNSVLYHRSAPYHIRNFFLALYISTYSGDVILSKHSIVVIGARSQIIRGRDGLYVRRRSSE